MGKKIACFGSFVAELTCRVDRLPVPGETMICNEFNFGAGGKGSNQAVATRRAGGNISLMVKIGDDPISKIAREHFKREKFDEKFIITDKEHVTGMAFIYVDKNTGQNCIVFYPGACEQITAADVDLFADEIKSCDIFLTQLEANVDSVERAVQIAWENKKTIVFNTAPARELSDDLLRKITIVTPNEVEASLLTKVQVVDKNSAEKAAKVFFEKGIPNIVITLGKKGCYVYDGKFSGMIEPIDVKTIDTTGAADAFNG